MRMIIKGCVFLPLITDIYELDNITQFKDFLNTVHVLEISDALLIRSFLKSYIIYIFFLSEHNPAKCTCSRKEERAITTHSLTMNG